MTASERAESPAIARLSSSVASLVATDWLVMAGIVLVGLVVRLVFDFGLVKVDPFTYADAAGSIVRGEPIYSADLTGHVYYTQYIRLSIIAPAALLYRLFGVSDGASVAWPLAVSLAMGPLAYWGGRMVSGRVAGVIAAAVVTLFPLNVINSTQFLPDIVVAGFASLAMVCFVAATEFERSRKERFWLYFSVGVGLAAAFYARATVVALLPPMAMLVVTRRRIGPELVGGVLGGALVLAMAQALILWLGATPFEDIRVLRELGSNGITNVDLGYARIFLRDRMFWPFFVYAGVGLGLFTWRRGPHALYRSPVFPWLVFVAGQYIYFEFFMTLPGVPTWWEEPRYALPLVFAVLLIGSCGWAELAKVTLPDRRNLAGVAAAAGGALLLVAAIPPVASEYDFYRHDGQRVDLDQITIAKLVPAGATVYVFDDDFARPLSYRLGLAGTVYERLVSDSGRLHNRLDAGGHSQVTAGSYVVVLPREQWWPLATAPAAHWQLIWQGESGVALYHVPEDFTGVTLQRDGDTTVARQASTVAAAWSTEWAVPQQQVVVEATLPSVAPPSGMIAVRFACDGYISPARNVTVPAGARVVRFETAFDVPPDHVGPCGLEVVGGDGSGERIGELSAPLLRVIQAEDALTAGSGWRAASAPFLSAGWGAVAEAGGIAAAQIGDLPAGDYWVELLVYDYGAGTNTVSVELNGARGSGSWGGDGKGPGMRRVPIHVTGAAAGTELGVVVESVGQEAALIDAVAIIDREPPEGF
ncbi:MAG TPA: glycosyltransferase family 39 protein [Tepidiformaceae bacterium]|nr:glycosyltransferase family 39 protein [Tepidiformaceae bacterium]